MHAARTLYLQTESRWTMSALTQYINDQAVKQGLISVGQHIHTNFIKRCLKESGVVDASISRMDPKLVPARRSEEHTSELQSLMRISYAVFCLKKKKTNQETLMTTKDNTTLQWMMNISNTKVYSKL